MGVITKGHTFTSGENVTADKLNNLADDATFNSNTTDNTTLEVHSTSGYLKVKDGGIDTAQLADGAVTEAKIADGAVTEAKIADGSITAAKIASGAALVSGSDISELNNDSGYTTNTGTVTEVDASGGLVTNPSSGITGTGTISIDTGGVTSDKISSTDTTFKITTSEVVINEGGADKDFRVEGTSQANLLIVDAGLNKVAVGGAYPSGANKAFYVNGDHTDGSIGCTGNIQINTNDNAGFRIFSINNSSPLQAADIFNDNQGTINFTRPQKTSNSTTHLFAEDGDTTSITGSYGTISDKNFKENIKYLTDEQKAGQIDDIKSLRFAKFNIKGDDRTQLGVIAQDVEQTSPNLVSKTVIDGKEVLAVKQSIIHQKAVVALQVALQKIEDLETRIKVLESK